MACAAPVNVKRCASKARPVVRRPATRNTPGSLAIFAAIVFTSSRDKTGNRLVEQGPLAMRRCIGFQAGFKPSLCPFFDPHQPQVPGAFVMRRYAASDSTP